MKIIPITLREANDFVEQHHRHSRRTSRDGGKWAIGASDGDQLVGIAIVGNPVSASLMDGVTAELLRCCVIPEAPKGACSFLYGRSWRIWQQMGGCRMITYTLVSESGASLRGAGWKLLGEVKPHRRWQDKGREWQPNYGQRKFRWGVSVAPP